MLAKLERLIGEIGESIGRINALFPKMGEYPGAIKPAFRRGVGPNCAPEPPEMLVLSVICFRSVKLFAQTSHTYDEWLVVRSNPNSILFSVVI